LKRVLSGYCLAVILLAGCAADEPPHEKTPVAVAPKPAPKPASKPAPIVASPTSSDPLDRPVAHLNGEPFTLGQLIGPLIESHGLTVLVNLLQVQQAREDATKAGITVTDADFKAERDTTLSGMFKDASDPLQAQIDQAEAKGDTAEATRLRAELERQQSQLLDQFLTQQHISPSEFDMILRINTYLRKIAEPAVNRSINEAAIKNAFNQIYGETVLVKIIQLANQTEVAEAQRRLARGDKFEDVAADMSHDPVSRALGGEIPRFSRQAPNHPEYFKDDAFSLQPGQVSDAVESEGSFYLIKMINRFAPRAVKFDAVKDSVRRQLFDAAVKAAVKELREDLARRVLQGLRIDDPVLSKQFDERVNNRESREKDRERIREDLDRQRRSTTAPANPPAPATQPATGQ
jgi:parvulin-like peptidyl-prolyl isomerase